MFYRCGHCGKIVSVVVDGEGSFNCCGEDMKALKANTSARIDCAQTSANSPRGMMPFTRCLAK